MLAAAQAHAQAVTLGDCERRTVVFGGEEGHRDLGQGRVSWRDWWSSEAAIDRLQIVDCTTGEGLEADVRTEGAGARLPFDRRPAAEAILDLEARAPHFFAFDRIARALERERIESRRYRREEQPCACAALYTGMETEMTQFDAESLQ